MDWRRIVAQVEDWGGGHLRRLLLLPLPALIALVLVLLLLLALAVPPPRRVLEEVEVLVEGLNVVARRGKRGRVRRMGKRRRKRRRQGELVVLEDCPRRRGRRRESWGGGRRRRRSGQTPKRKGFSLRHRGRSDGEGAVGAMALLELR